MYKSSNGKQLFTKGKVITIIKDLTREKKVR
jgi:hypothetical protein